MNQEDLIKALSHYLFLTQTETREALEFAIRRIAKDLKKGERIYIRNFGSLHRIKRKRKRVRNVQTGELMIIPEHYTVEFRPSTTLLDKIR